MRTGEWAFRYRLAVGSRGLSRKSWAQALQTQDNIATGDRRRDSISAPYSEGAVEGCGSADTPVSRCESSFKIGAGHLMPSIPRSDLDEEIFATIRSAFTARLPLKGQGKTGCSPIFVIGLPETGTRVVASILSRHPAVALPAENGTFADVLCKVTGKAMIDADAIRRIVGVSADRIGRAYVQAAYRGGKGDGLHVVEEHALNFLYVGFILQALPHARVLCVRRGAMDSAWNLYGQRLTAPFDYWGASTQEAARLVLLFQRLMGFWRQRFPGRIHEVTYEWLTADPETETRRMLAHCGLDWHPGCTLPTIENDIGRWRDCAGQLTPVIEFFAAHGITAD